MRSGLGDRAFRFVLTLGLNVAHPALRSTKVRLALNHAVDRQEILEGDLGGHGEIATGPVSLRWLGLSPSCANSAYAKERSMGSVC